MKLTKSELKWLISELTYVYKISIGYHNGTVLSIINKLKRELKEMEKN